MSRWGCGARPCDPPTSDPGLDEVPPHCMDCLFFSEVVATSDEGEDFFEDRGVCTLDQNYTEREVCDSCGCWEKR